MPEIRKKGNFLQISIFHSVGCSVNEMWKVENNHQISIFHSVSCFVEIDQKVNITVITTLETDWPQEATLSVIIKSYIENWILNVGPNFTTVRITLWLCFGFCKMSYRGHFSGI